MADVIQIDGNAVAFLVSQQPRPGAERLEDGTYADGDVMLCVTVSVGCSRPGGLLAGNGKRHGQMVPVATLTRPLGEFLAHARALLGAAAPAEVTLDG